MQIFPPNARRLLTAPASSFRPCIGTNDRKSALRSTVCCDATTTVVALVLLHKTSVR